MNSNTNISNSEVQLISVPSKIEVKGVDLDITTPIDVQGAIQGLGMADLFY